MKLINNTAYIIVDLLTLRYNLLIIIITIISLLLLYNASTVVDANASTVVDANFVDIIVNCILFRSDGKKCQVFLRVCFLLKESLQIPLCWSYMIL